MTGTASTRRACDGARDHARAPGRRGRRRRGARSRRRRPTDLPAGVAADGVVWDETVGAGGYAGRRLPRGDRPAHRRPRRRRLRAPRRATTPATPAERLNVADTVKVQWQAYLGAGARAAVGHGPGADDDRRRHERPPRRPVRHDERGRRTRRGTATAASTAAHADAPRAADRRPPPSTASDRRDLPPGINLFKRRRRSATTARSRFDGAPAARRARSSCAPRWTSSCCWPTCPHPLDDRPAYTASTVRLTAWRGRPTATDDPLRAVDARSGSGRSRTPTTTCWGSAR